MLLYIEHLLGRSNLKDLFAAPDIEISQETVRYPLEHVWSAINRDYLAATDEWPWELTVTSHCLRHDGT